MPKCPYNFSERSRAGMIAAIQEIGNKRFYDHKSWPFCWNVKWPYLPDADKAACLEPFNDGEPFTAQRDKAWQSEMESEGFDYGIIEDCRLSVEDLTDYDGNGFEVYFLGRQGGWLCLKSGLGFDFAGFDPDDLNDKESYSFADVKALYRALVTFEADFSRDNVRNQFLHAIAFARARWEESRRETLGTLASDIIEARATARRMIGEYRKWGLPPMIATAARAEIRRLMRAQRQERKSFADIMQGVGS